MPEEELLTMGFSFLSGEPGVMPGFHRHKEVEINLVAAGEMTYLFGGSWLPLPPGQVAVFWATIPHRVVRLAPETRFYCIHLPLARFLQWQLPDGFTHRLLHGEMVREPDAAQAAHDQVLFERWRLDLSDPSSESRKIVLLELEARLRRLAQRSSLPTKGRSAALTAGGQEIDKVERMAGFIAERYQNPIMMGEIAAAVGLHPKYAMTLFRNHCGMTLGEYLTQQRLSQAQRLLATTDAKVVDVAFAAGFGSVSRFYEVFERACGQSPKTYRASLRK